MVPELHVGFVKQIISTTTTPLLSEAHVQPNKQHVPTHIHTSENDAYHIATPQ